MLKRLMILFVGIVLLTSFIAIVLFFERPVQRDMQGRRAIEQSFVTEFCYKGFVFVHIKEGITQFIDKDGKPVLCEYNED